MAVNERRPKIPTLEWDKPSGKSLHSTPLGNGEIGANVWVEPPGDIVFYLSKSDAWSEQGRLLKLGRIRLSITPPLFALDAYLERLELSTATVRIEAGMPDSRISVRIWVDAHLPVVRIEADFDQPATIQAKVELWRTEPRELTQDDLQFGLHGSPHIYVEGADTMLPPRGDQLVWFHRNETSVWLPTMELQGLGDFAQTQSDPLLGRTFGCAMSGEGMVAKAPNVLQGHSQQQKWSISICAHTALAKTTDEWTQGLENEIEKVSGHRLEDARRHHEEWWNQFWDRSWIDLRGSPEAERVSQGYRLQRYYNACAGRGKFPIKFNGSLFTVEHIPQNPDYRRWGGGYWFQNTRLAYWPMLAAGDTELMSPLFRMFREQLPLAIHRTQKYFQHEGAYFGETQTFWGAYQNFDFGWDGAAARTGEIQNKFIRWHLNGNLELLMLMLGYFRHTQDRAFARDELVPMAKELLKFFDSHYPRDAQGRLRLEPGQALETFWEAANNTPDVSGLRAVLDALLTLQEEMINPETRSDWLRIREMLPPIPIEEGVRILPAESFGEITNYENAELYPIFPFRLFGVGLPELDLARKTYALRTYHLSAGWSQDEIHAALLGLAGEAREGLIHRFSSLGQNFIGTKEWPEAPRFPACWGPNYDWIPDMDHGGSGMIALQFMLVQEVEDVLHLLPAWPADWEVDFKLWISGQRVVTGAVRDGRMIEYGVTPEGADLKIEVHLPQN